MSDIGEHVSVSGEAASDADWSAPEDGKGMTIEDAATSAFDDLDRAANGISEGEREPMGKWLKGHADHIGLSVEDGLKSVIAPAAILHNGSQEQKRELLGTMIDNFQIHPEPSAETAQQYDEFGDAIQPMQYDTTPQQGQVIGTEAQAQQVIAEFIRDNPAAQSADVQDRMILVAEGMRAQGFQPDLASVYQTATGEYPQARNHGALRHKWEADRQAEEKVKVEAAKRANVQISGSGTSAPTGGNQSDDIIDLLDSVVPKGW